MLKTINVFLDTQVFYGYQFDLRNSVFKQLIELRSAGAIRVFSTDVVKREIQKHLKDRATKAITEIDKLRKCKEVRPHYIPAVEAMADLTEDSIRAHLLSQFSDFWNRLAVKELPYPPETLTMVLDRYFEIQPPFENNEKKKHEFPDAISAHAVMSWCREQEGRMLVVSGDKGWKDVCETDSRLAYRERLAELLSEFPDVALVSAIRDGIKSLEETIGRAFDSELGGCVLSAEAGGYRVVEGAIGAVTLGDIFIVEAAKGCGTAEIDLAFEYEALLVPKAYPGILNEPDVILMQVDTRPRRAKGKAVVTTDLYFSYDTEEPSFVDIDSDDPVISQQIRLEPKTFIVSELSELAHGRSGRVYSDPGPPATE